MQNWEGEAKIGAESRGLRGMELLKVRQKGQEQK